MSDLDDRIRRGLESLAAPSEPGDVFGGIERRKRRRKTVRRAQRGLLAVAVLAGSVGGALALNRAFQGGGSRLGEEPTEHRLIAVERTTDEGTQIYLMREDGTDTRPLLGVGWDQFDPAWSADGNWIAFVDESGVLYKVRPTGTDLTPLTPESHGLGLQGVREPAWSPSGDQIALSATGRTTRAVRSIAVISRRGDSPGVPYPFFWSDPSFAPSWSPDGTRLAYVLERGGDADIVTSLVRSLRPEDDTIPVTSNDGIDDVSPAWNPTGSTIVYVSQGDLWLTDPAGVTHTNLTASPELESDPYWSADGEWILFAQRSGDGPGDLYRMTPDPDSDRVPVNTDPASDLDPAWQPIAVELPVPGPTPSPSSTSGCVAAPPGRPWELAGDISGDGQEDRVHLAFDVRRCWYELLVSDSGGTLPDEGIFVGRPREGGPPALMMLAQIDGRPGLEIVVDLSPAAVFRTAAVFRMSDRGLTRMLLTQAGEPTSPQHFPFSDEVPIGIDCAGQGIVLTAADYSAAQEDEGLDPLPFTRTFLEAEGRAFLPVRTDRVTIPADEVFENGGASVYRELGGTPFLSCPGRIQ